MDIEFQNTEKDYKSFYVFYYKNALRKNIFILILIPLSIGYIVAGQPFALTTFIDGVIISALLFVGSFYVVPYLISIHNLNKAILKDPWYLEKRKLSITDEGIYCETDTISGIWRWESIVSFEFNDEFLALILADKKFYLIPQKAFPSNAEAINFLGIIQSKVIKPRGTIKPLFATADKKPPYLLGLICLIPLIGAFIGLVFIILGVTRFKDKWFTLIGVFGIAFTIIIYSTLFYTNKHSFKNELRALSQTELNDLVKDIEFYKLENGQYPDSLQQLTKDNSNDFIFDPVQANQRGKNSLFYYLKVGDKYRLFSKGEDGIPYTKDDIYPQVSDKVVSKIGLIRYALNPDTVNK
ncbi:YcxB family protein [Microbacter margulisiae]|uniref:YcxB-like C-terminal domain-containing protein n=1 Tax=Microbacter margulisiae TaxID=1350067 RepID=A0A7W5H3W0_9PORP|nr:YcxB family protein [Microbacter margulisiae]MBB3188747.1 hypothetical protein [Microbacter margulisiae]